MRKHNLVKTNRNDTGVQHLYRFKNGYGASVVKSDYSYGGRDGFWELAVIVFKDDGKFELTYDTPITGDVLGYLTEVEVDKTLSQINKLEDAS